MASPSTRAAGRYPAPQSLAGGDRLPWIDLLRVLAVAWLVPFHAARVFDPWEAFYIKDAEASGLVSTVIGATGPWHMPLLFVLAGMSSQFALKRRSAGEYVGERVRRLLVPFLFGLAVIVPPQAYIARLAHGADGLSFGDFLAGYLAVGDLSGYDGAFTPGHLWFILYLFVLSLVALPLFTRLASSGGAGTLARIVDRVRGWSLVTVPVVGLALLAILPAPGGKNPFVYLALFVAGYALVADRRLLDLAVRIRRAALVIGLVALLAVNVAWFRVVPLERTVVTWAVFGLVFQLASWLLVLAILAYGARLLNRGGAWLRYASEIAFPFYIWHQTVLVAVAFVVVGWDLPVLAKFTVITFATFAATLAATELTRRTAPGRFLFGMKAASPKAQGAREVPAAGTA